MIKFYGYETGADQGLIVTNYFRNNELQASGSLRDTVAGRRRGLKGLKRAGEVPNHHALRAHVFTIPGYSSPQNPATHATKAQAQASRRVRDHDSLGDVFNFNSRKSPFLVPFDEPF